MKRKLEPKLNNMRKLKRNSNLKINVKLKLKPKLKNISKRKAHCRPNWA